MPSKRRDRVAPEENELASRAGNDLQISRNAEVALDQGHRIDYPSLLAKNRRSLPRQSCIVVVAEVVCEASRRQRYDQLEVPFRAEFTLNQHWISGYPSHRLATASSAAAFDGH